MDIVTDYAHLSQGIVNVTGMSRPMLHMVAGMSIYLPFRLIVRGPVGALLAVMLVVGAELSNELLQILYYESPRWLDTIGDVILTILGPILCCCLMDARIRAPKLADRTKTDQAPEAKSEPACHARKMLVAERIRSSEGRGEVDWIRSWQVGDLQRAA